MAKAEETYIPNLKGWALRPKGQSHKPKPQKRRHTITDTTDTKDNVKANLAHLPVDELARYRFIRNAHPGLKLLTELPPDQVDKIVDAIFQTILTEVKINLGLIRVDDDYDDEKTPFFDAINAAYQEAAHGCYFCDETVDFNEDQFGSTYLCLSCQAKLGNALVFYGFDNPEEYLPFAMNSKKVQKLKHRKFVK